MFYTFKKKMAQGGHKQYVSEFLLGICDQILTNYKLPIVPPGVWMLTLPLCVVCVQVRYTLPRRAYLAPLS